jgi:myosin heavy subunit
MQKTISESNIRIEEMKSQWEISKSQFEATVNNVQQEALQTQQELQERSSIMLKQEMQNSQQMKGILNNFEMMVCKKESELDDIRQLRNKENQLNESLLSRQRQLEQEKDDLMREQTILKQRYEMMCSTISMMERDHEIQLKKSEEDMSHFQELKQSLQDSQHTLNKLEKDYEDKLRSSNRAKEAVEKVRGEVIVKAELLAKQLEIYRKHGLSPKEKAFQETLDELKRLFKNHQPPKCFISYAWEDRSTPSGEEANLHMQQWIGRLTNDLRKLGMQVFFDLDNMKNNLKSTMIDNITRSDYFIIICTPRWKERIQDGLTATLMKLIDNEQFEQLEEGLKQLETNPSGSSEFNPKNNAALEFVHIWKKSETCTILPICYMGSIKDATLPCIRAHFIRKVDDVHKDENYYGVLLKTSDPLGIIPNIYQVRDVGQEDFLKEYNILFNFFNLRIQSVDDQMRQAEYESKIPKVEDEINVNGMFSFLLVDFGC